MPFAVRNLLFPMPFQQTGCAIPLSFQPRAPHLGKVNRMTLVPEAYQRR
jgi:hypothetical protein